jgi:flavorubredoxin
MNITKIDYIISNHAEQDHSGGINKVLETYSMAKVVTNSKCKEMLMDLLLIPENKFIVINDGETLSLGNKTLTFIITPWVHWPETMLTYLIEDKILFSCDLFGSHLASDEFISKGDERLLLSAKRYYAEIMMPFRQNIKIHLEKLKKFDVSVIAPSHGPIYLKPDLIINAYNSWVSDEVKNLVVLPYVSMHGSTLKMVEHLSEALKKKNVGVKLFNLTKTDIGELAMSLVDAATVIIASSTILIGPHPSILYAAYLTNVLRPKLKFISIIGSYGWGGKMADFIRQLITNIKPEFIEPVIIKGYPKKMDFKKLDELAEQVYQKHKGLNLIK